MSFEPQKFFIGVIDFFSVILPGALLAYLGWQTIDPKHVQARFGRVVEIKQKHLDEKESQILINAYQWAKVQLNSHNPSGLAEVQRMEADSKFFRSLVVVLGLFIGLLSLRAFLHPEGWLCVFICIGLLGLSFWRYVERRFKATQLAYYFVISLHADEARSRQKARTPPRAGAKE